MPPPPLHSSQLNTTTTHSHPQRVISVSQIPIVVEPLGVYVYHVRGSLDLDSRGVIYCCTFQFVGDAAVRLSKSVDCVMVNAALDEPVIAGLLDRIRMR